MDVTPLRRIRALPQHYYNEGLDAAVEGRVDIAIERLSTAVTLDGSHCAAHKALGDIYSEGSAYTEAANQYAKALQLEPENDTLRQLKHEADMRANSEAVDRRVPRFTQPILRRTLLVAVPLAAFLLGVAVEPLVNVLARRDGEMPVDSGRLAAEVERRLASEPALNGLSLSIAQAEGSLRVSGEVPTDVYRSLVSEVASNAVLNQIPVVVELRVAGKPTTPASLYTVRRGDSLTSIAVAQYGDSRMWTTIYAANQGTITSSDRLSVGQVVVIPK